MTDISNYIESDVSTNISNDVEPDFNYYLGGVKKEFIPNLRNSTSFVVKLSVRLHELHEEYIKIKSEGDIMASVLKYHQWLVMKWMSEPEFIQISNGLLIYHEMGMGKSILAVGVAMALIEIGIYPIIILPKSLQNNMLDSVAKVMRMINPSVSSAEITAMQAKFSFVSSDAYNMSAQLSKIGHESGGNPLENKVLIIDEAHNLFRAIVNSSNDETNARKLYNMVMNTSNLRKIFLTGTPVVKNVFEVVPMFNMLAGKIILPLQYDVFYELYVDTNARRIKNREAFQNRILGLVSHASSSLPNEPGVEKKLLPVPRDTGYFPELLPLKVIRVEMSKHQYKKYLLAREKEEMEMSSRSFRRETRKNALSLPTSEMGQGMSTYYVKSRMISNYAPFTKHEGQAISKIPGDGFTEENSPKLYSMSKMIASQGLPSTGYSQFIDYGLAALGRYLELHNMIAHETRKKKTQTPGPAFDNSRNYDTNIAAEIYSEEKLEKKVEEKGKTIGGKDTEKNLTRQEYALLSGQVEVNDRKRIQDMYNSPENKDGSVIKHLGFSASGAEGLDLKNGTTFFGTEPYWYMSRIDQAIARIRRPGSLDLLQRDQREIQPYLFISVANKEIYDGIPDGQYKETMTIDEKFYERSMEQSDIVNDMRKILREVSIECVVNGYGNCRICMPTGKPLYHADPIADVKTPDNCEPYVETEAEVQEINLDTEKYYYRKIGDNIEFYQYDPALEAYVNLQSDDPIIDKLMKLMD